ncbi:MAG TPA: DUF2330 domain-containing protein, partial [Sandaracinaceae bacterium LLY-WYZ-13_1]|nr:DUF2330 domain-containing protein [Sandaracinaceae bacterium LLY-WYZ-13_1]
MGRRAIGAGLLLAVGLAAPRPAAAFCGFYVSGAESELYNQATMVVMMRDGTRTVLSMQNSYQGPPEDFAMVVPVPVVLSEDDVKTLNDEVFDRVDRLAAPRLVEYWEQDPCYQPPPPMDMARGCPTCSVAMPMTAEGGGADLGVTVEAEFVVGEYEIVILSAEDSSGLDTWLRREGYHIPDGAEPVLRPYVEQGTKFFVARVDLEQVTREDGRAMLSPLRFHYDSETFSLPVRLGLLNSGGEQDLIVHILARGQRYEVANYDNVTIPTNLVVSQGVRNEFGPFYASLFDRLVERNPNHVVTEYAWDASSCDPCPTPALSPQELAILGADVVDGGPGGFTLTRLHYRYSSEELGEDLVFRAAEPIVGGRGMPDQQGQLSEQRAQPAPRNHFQGRYVMLNWWDGPVECDDPVRGRWGGPPSGGEPAPQPATDLAFVERNRTLGSYLEEDVPELGVSGAPQDRDDGSRGAGTTSRPPVPQGGGCASCSA